MRERQHCGGKATMAGNGQLAQWTTQRWTTFTMDNSVMDNSRDGQLDWQHDGNGWLNSDNEWLGNGQHWMVSRALS